MNSTGEVVVSDFEHSGHPVFRASSALDRGFLKKAGGKCSTSAKLLFRAINFANQLSIYGAVADWFSELIQQIFGQSFSRMKESTANVNEQLYRTLERQEVHALVRTLELNVQAARDRPRDHQEKFENLSREIQSVSDF